MSWMLANYGIDFEIDTTPFGSAQTWAPICDGFDNVTEALNEQVQEFFSLCAKGFGFDEVVANHPGYTLTGYRKIGDAAQDFIFSTRFETMAGRHTSIRVSEANADGSITRRTAKVTLKGLSAMGGSSTQGAAVAVTFSFNGRPVTETIAASENLSVTSVAGDHGNHRSHRCADVPGRRVQIRLRLRRDRARGDARRCADRLERFCKRRDLSDCGRSERDRRNGQCKHVHCHRQRYGCRCFRRLISNNQKCGRYHYGVSDQKEKQNQRAA